MRFALIALMAALAAAYTRIAIGLYQQDVWSLSPESCAAAERVRHPAASLGILRNAFESGDYSNELQPLLQRARVEAPSFYQWALFQAVYRANRLEEPGRVRSSFQEALRLFPANGRLRLTFAEWLLKPRPTPPQPFRKASATVVDSLDEAGSQIAIALGLEPDLTAEALRLARRYGVPPERWESFVPQDPRARWELVRALSGARHGQQALRLVEEWMSSGTAGLSLEEAAHLALRWNDTALALRAAKGWREQTDSKRPPLSTEIVRATLLVVRCHLVAGDNREAYRVFHQTLESLEDQPDTPPSAPLELLTGMGLEYLRSGQAIMAQSLLLKAHRIDPQNRLALLGLARAHAGAGESRTAVTYYRQILKLGPEDAEARAELEALLSARSGNETH